MELTYVNQKMPRKSHLRKLFTFVVEVMRHLLSMQRLPVFPQCTAHHGEGKQVSQHKITRKPSNAAKVKDRSRIIKVIFQIYTILHNSRSYFVSNIIAGMRNSQKIVGQIAHGRHVHLSNQGHGHVALIGTFAQTISKQELWLFYHWITQMKLMLNSLYSCTDEDKEYSTLRNLHEVKEVCG